MRYFFHHYKDVHTKLLFKDGVDRLPEFNLAYNKAEILLLKEKKNDEELSYYPITVFRFALYREPGKAILQVFLPMFILSFFVIITMIVEDATLADQLPNLATIFLAYIAFLPTVRASIPSVAYATFTDYTVYSYLFATLTSIGDNLMKRYKMNSDATYWFFFITTCLLIFIPVLFVVFFMFKYQADKRGFDQKHVRKEKESSVGFNSNGWSNEEWVKQALPEWKLNELTLLSQEQEQTLRLKKDSIDENSLDITKVIVLINLTNNLPYK